MLFGEVARSDVETMGLSIAMMATFVTMLVDGIAGLPSRPMSMGMLMLFRRHEKLPPGVLAAIDQPLAGKAARFRDG